MKHFIPYIGLYFIFKDAEPLEDAIPSIVFQGLLIGFTFLGLLGILGFLG